MAVGDFKVRAALFWQLPHTTRLRQIPTGGKSARGKGGWGEIALG